VNFSLNTRLNTDKQDTSRPELIVDFSIEKIGGKLSSEQYQQINNIVKWVSEWEKKKKVRDESPKNFPCL
jgi:hypothetical protein